MKTLHNYVLALGLFSGLGTMGSPRLYLVNTTTPDFVAYNELTTEVLSQDMR